jgi:hypothetical protein
LAEIFEHVAADEFEDIVSMHKRVGQAMRDNDLWFYEGADQFTRTR